MVTASIVVHRTPESDLSTALKCLAASAVVDAVWVIDNSPDASLRSVAVAHGARYVKVDNRGFGAGHNVAIRRALDRGARYHIVMNADVRWEGDVPATLAAYMDSHPDVGQCMPRTIYPDGMLQYTARRLPTPLDLFAKRFLPKSLTQRLMHRYLLAEADHSAPFNVPYLLGSFMFFRCDALRAEGLFDERFFMYPEDIDITRRIHRHWLTMYLPIATIVHAHAAASRHSSRMLRIHIVNMVRYFNKWGWLIDPERRHFNRRLSRTLPRKSPPLDIGRG